MITSLDGRIIHEETVSVYQIKSTIEICEKYIKPAFEVIKKTPPYLLEIKAECIKDG